MYLKTYGYIFHCSIFFDYRIVLKFRGWLSIPLSLNKFRFSSSVAIRTILEGNFSLNNFNAIQYLIVSLSIHLHDCIYRIQYPWAAQIMRVVILKRIICLQIVMCR